MFNQKQSADQEIIKQVEKHISGNKQLTKE